MKDKRHAYNQKLRRLRIFLLGFVLFLLLFPFVLQQTFFPFFRFGMFAEPVTRTIQKEQFKLVGEDQQDSLYTDISKFTGIKKSRMDYLLRNYYYRDEVDFFLKESAELLPEEIPFETLILLRILDDDTTVVDSYGLWK